MTKPRILVVEDDDIARSFLSDILVESGYEVAVAENGGVALELLSGRVPDLIISDVLMPEVSGIDLFREIQKMDTMQSVPFIFLTCLDEGQEVLDLEELGPDDYMVKPVRPRHLLARVRGKLRRKQQREDHVERERDELRDRIRWTLSHELRTPLTVIQGISEILLNDGSVPEATDYQELLTSLKTQSFALNSMVEKFLLVTRIDAGVEESTWKSKAGPCPLAEVVEEAAFPWLETGNGRHPGLGLDVCDDLPDVHVCRTHAVEILRQVLDNAFKFADKESPRVTVAATAAEGQGCVIVTDNGKGIPAAQRDRVFEKLTQFDREVQEQQGSGLGLFIAKSLADINHATIAVDDATERGTRVEVRFASGA